MQRNVIPIFIVALTIVFVIITFAVSFRYETNRISEVAHIKNAPSEIYARMLVKYSKPPILQEEWKMSDVEGVSNYDYRIRGYSGLQIEIRAPQREMHDVSYWFGQVDRDGVWQLQDQPPRGDTSATYTISVKQLVDYKQGERTVTFTDPHYWATTRSFNIDLSKQSPGDFLKMQSTAAVQPGYEAVVNDFLTFGPPQFQASIAKARARVRASK